MTKNRIAVPFLIYFIATYFLVIGLANLLSALTEFVPRSPNEFEFLYVSLPGILSNEPISASIINTIPLFDVFSVYLKEIATIATLFYTGYLLLKMKKLGLHFGLFISIFGLIFGTTYGLRLNISEYIQNIMSGITTYGFNDLSWVIMGICFIITLFIPIYLFLKRNLFTN